MKVCPNRAISDAMSSRTLLDHRAWAGKGWKIRRLVGRRRRGKNSLAGSNRFPGSRSLRSESQTWAFMNNTTSKDVSWAIVVPVAVSLRQADISSTDRPDIVRVADQTGVGRFVNAAALFAVYPASAVPAQTSSKLTSGKLTENLTFWDCKDHCLPDSRYKTQDASRSA